MPAIPSNIGNMFGKCRAADSVFARNDDARIAFKRFYSEPYLVLSPDKNILLSFVTEGLRYLFYAYIISP